MRGHNVCIVEKNKLEGRTQEWNISRHELQVLYMPLYTQAHPWLKHFKIMLIILHIWKKWYQKRQGLQNWFNPSNNEIAGWESQ